MYSFKNDYSEGAHSTILEAMLRSNLEQTPGYGDDKYTEEAKTLIKKEIGREDVLIQLFVGGTQTNLTAIASFLRPHQAAIAVETGHIATHETGAIEATGHKVLTTKGIDGKLTVEDIKQVLAAHTDEHMVRPKLAYISNSTEIGTHYTKKELMDLYATCQELNLFLFIDGARVGSALCAEDNDLTMKDLAQYSDAFYIGGTKNGALMGEALIICNDLLKEDFKHLTKQRGALLAKGRLLGIQFAELFRDGLFYDLAIHANRQAMRLQEGIEALGYCMSSRSSTNQIFPIFTLEIANKLQQKYAFYFWEAIDEKTTSIRLVTSWATTDEAVEAFLNDLEALTTR